MSDSENISDENEATMMWYHYLGTCVSSDNDCDEDHPVYGGKGLVGMAYQLPGSGIDTRLSVTVMLVYQIC